MQAQEKMKNCGAQWSGKFKEPLLPMSADIVSQVSKCLLAGDYGTFRRLILSESQLHLAAQQSLLWEVSMNLVHYTHSDGI